MQGIAVGEGVAPIELDEHNCFGCGSLNAHGLRMTMHVEPGRAWSELTLSDQFEGWEGVIHGGILATLLDEVMGWALADGDDWGVTARLNVEYRKPVHVGASIRAEGWVERSRRRVMELGARIVDTATGLPYATATATYVTVDDERKRQLRERYGIRRRAASSTDTPELVAR
jgi:uncharacterized protein (TIGR00369 family)